jgi:hypothetical protein
MIPQEIIDVTEQAYLGYVGSRDEKMIPMTRQCWGMDIKAVEDMVIIYVVQRQFEPMLKNFQQNGRITISLTDLYSHTSYQLKGQFLKARAMTEAETVLQQQYRVKPMDFIIALGYSEEQVERYLHQADLALEVKIEKTFNQTPGPGAGKEITN